MTANRGLFVRNVGTTGTTPIEGRLVLASLVAENSPGNPRNGLLDQKATTVVSGTATMTYSVAPCTVIVNRAAGEGVYMFTLTGTSTVATTNAPGTGSRWDLIYVKQNDPDKGDATNTAVLAVLQGTASTGTPTKPYATLPAGAYILAEAQVSAGATATNGGSVAISQVWRYTALRGAPIPVRSTTERDEITGQTGLLVKRLDFGPAYIESYNGSAWVPAIEKPFGHMGRTAGFMGVQSSDTVVQMDTAQVLKGGMTFDNSNDALVVPVAGYYRVNAQFYATGGQGSSAICHVWKVGSGSPTGVSTRFWKADSGDYVGHATGIVLLSAGDKLRITMTFPPSSTWGTNGYDGSYLEVEYLAAP